MRALWIAGSVALVAAALTWWPFSQPTFSKRDIQPQQLDVASLVQLWERSLPSFYPLIEREIKSNKAQSHRPIVPRLMATLVDGENSLAVVFWPSQGVCQVKKGDQLSGWSVVRIEEEKLVLRKNRKVMEVKP